MPFRFKQFAVEDDRSTMKVGTDAMLLGAWVNVGSSKKILDVGAGSGVIALMLAQRSNATIDAVEPDADSARQASENFAASPWNNRLRVFNKRLQELETNTYDLIVSNPPFFSKSLLPPETSRQNARHTETLSFDDLLSSAKNKRLAIILPTVEGDAFRAKAVDYGLYCNRRLAFYSRQHKAQERWMMEFSPKMTEAGDETLVLYDGKDKWSTGYGNLVKDFLTKLYI
ncbi:MAG TPA: methyltransferase [Cyclobacteriaceae bacterium]